MTPYADMVLMVDVFAACIETRTLPVPGSPCHKRARRMVEESGCAPERERMEIKEEVPNA